MLLELFDRELSRSLLLEIERNKSIRSFFSQIVVDQAIELLHPIGLFFWVVFLHHFSSPHLS